MRKQRQIKLIMASTFLLFTSRLAWSMEEDGQEPPRKIQRTFSQVFLRDVDKMLFKAVEPNTGGDVEAARQALDAGANVNSTDWDTQRSVLHNALCTDNGELVQLLLESGADVSDHDPSSLFHFLFPQHRYNGNWSKNALAIAKLLVHYGAKLPKENLQTYLQNAIVQNDPAFVEWLISQGARLDAYDDNGLLPVHNAFAYNYWLLGKLLIEKYNCNIDSTADTEDCLRNPLHYALSNLNLVAAEWLLGHGATITVWVHDLFFTVPLLRLLMAYGVPVGLLTERHLKTLLKEKDYEDGRNENDLIEAALYVLIHDDTVPPQQVQCIMQRQEAVEEVLPGAHLRDRVPKYIWLILMADEEGACENFKTSIASGPREREKMLNQAFRAAAARGYTKMLGLLLEHQKNMSDPLINWPEVIESAVLSNRIDSLGVIIESKLIDRHRLVSALTNTLQLAAAQRNARVVKYILELDQKMELAIPFTPIIQHINNLLDKNEFYFRSLIPQNDAIDLHEHAALFDYYHGEAEKIRGQYRDIIKLFPYYLSLRPEFRHFSDYRCTHELLQIIVSFVLFNVGQPKTNFN